MKPKKMSDMFLFKKILVDTPIGTFEIEIFKTRLEKMIRGYGKQVSIKKIDGINHYFGSHIQPDYLATTIQHGDIRQGNFYINKMNYKPDNIAFSFMFKSTIEIPYLINNAKRDLQNRYSGWECECKPLRVGR